MKPHIDGTEFGSITVAGRRIENDVLIRLDGEVTKRRKKLSKAVYGTSHIISAAEAEQVCEKGAECLLVGSGQSGMVRLSDEAAAYFARQGIKVTLAPTPAAIRLWNEAKGRLIGLFHVTC
jgi:hypothetical protein